MGSPEWARTSLSWKTLLISSANPAACAEDPVPEWFSDFLCIPNCLAGLLKSVLGPPPECLTLAGAGEGLGENLH